MLGGIYDKIRRMALPEAITQYLHRSDETPAESVADQTHLDSLLSHLLSRRKVAISGRRESGIEDIWDYAEDAYAGIDDANRHEFSVNRWCKPGTMDVGMSNSSERDDDGRCTIFIPLTRRYVNAAVAKVIEVTQAPDEKSFGMEPTPVPELAKQEKDVRQVVGADGVALQRDPTPLEVNPPRTGGTPDFPSPIRDAPPQDLSRSPGVPLTYADLAKEKLAITSDQAEAAAKRLHDWFVECHLAREERKVIHDMAKLGVGIMKGPVVDLSRYAVATRHGEALAIELREDVRPVGRRVKPQFFYPDPSCGESVQNAEYAFEKIPLSRHQLQRMAKLPGYRKRAIAEALRQGPNHTYDETRDHENSVKTSTTRSFDGWLFYGFITQDEFRAAQLDANAGVDGAPIDYDDQLKDLVDVPIQATLVNDQVIHVTIQPLTESGAIPYYTASWTDREGHWAGVGVPEIGMSAQRIVNQSVRRKIDNDGFSAGMQLIIDLDLIEPVPIRGERNPLRIRPVKVWTRKVGAMDDDVRKAMHTVQFPSAHAQLVWNIEFGIRLFEEVTNIPLVSQGWSGKTTPDTAEGMRLQDTNANQMLRDVAQSYDHGIKVPLVRGFYEYLLLDPSVPDEEKGDVRVLARGSTDLMERSLQEGVLERSAQLIMGGHALFEVDPVKYFEELWRSKRLNPVLIKYTKAQLEKKAQMPPPEPPEVTVAKMRGEIELKNSERTHEFNMKELELKREVAQLQYETAIAKMTSEERRELEKNKRSVAETVMKLKTQKEISVGSEHATQVANPATEPPGVAPDGRAFEL